MTKRHLLSLSLPRLLALTACSGPEAPAPAATPAPAAPAETAAPSAPATQPGEAAATAAEPAQAAAPAPAASAPTGPAPVAGVDYIEIANGQAFQPAAGKIEVAEVFGYTCPHCAQFEPEFQAWKQRQAADVAVVQVPAAFGGYWLPYARAFYAAEALGVQEKTHDAVYAAIHLEQTLNGERSPNDKPQDIANFYGKQGVDPKTFLDTMGSFSVVAKTNRAKQFAQRSKITGTPSLIVNGKYLVKGKSYEDMLRIADHLIARERAAGAK